MSFCIRLFIIILSLSGCVAIDIADLPSNIKNLLSFELKSSNSIVNSVSADTNDLIILNQKTKKSFRLADKNNQYLTWSYKDINLKTLQGKFIRSSGFQNDFNIIIDEKDINSLFKNNASIDALISFSDPKTSFLNISYNYRNIDLNKANLDYPISGNNYKLVEENFNVRKIRWVGSNLYLINENGEIIYSEQYLDPFSKKTISYYQ